MKEATPSGSDRRASGVASVKEPAPREELALFAERYMHFTNLWTVYHDMLTGHYVPTVAPPGEGWAPFPNTAATVMFLLYSMFYSLIDDDPKSVNAFRIWRRNFPEEESAIAAVETQVSPFKMDLKRFRNRLGFHGSRSRAHEASGFDLFANHSGTAILNAMRNFKHLGAILLHKDMEKQKAP